MPPSPVGKGGSGHEVSLDCGLFFPRLPPSSSLSCRRATDLLTIPVARREAGPCCSTPLIRKDTITTPGRSAARTQRPATANSQQETIARFSRAASRPAQYPRNPFGVATGTTCTICNTGSDTTGTTASTTSRSREPPRILRVRGAQFLSGTVLHARAHHSGSRDGRCRAR